MRHLKELIRPFYLKWFYFRWKPENCPRSFLSCWWHPQMPLHSPSLEFEPQAGDRPDIVFLPMGDWHTARQRTQHFASTFAAMGHRCFYLNPHLGREFPTTYLNSPKTVVSSIEPRVWELHIHLIREPVFHHRCLLPEENRMVAATVERLLRTANSSNPVLVVSFPLWGEVATELSEKFGCRIVYDCHDLLAGFGNISADLIQAEERLMKRSDLVLFSAAKLLESTVEKIPEIGKKSVLVRNGVDVGDFAAAAVRGERREEARTIGYVGALNFWFDTQAVMYAARAHPEWRFLLVGHVGSGNFDELRDISNVHFLGEVAYADLPSQLQQMDVGIIPFLKLPLTMATNPIKMYEYFACGLPVVSTRLPEVEAYDGKVYLADSPEEFCRQLETAMKEDNLLLREERIHIARYESWQMRCRQLGEEIGKLECRAVHGWQESL